jgi:hypothetical protein
MRKIQAALVAHPSSHDPHHAPALAQIKPLPRNQNFLDRLLRATSFIGIIFSRISGSYIRRTACECGFCALEIDAFVVIT